MSMHPLQPVPSAPSPRTAASHTTVQFPPSPTLTPSCPSNNSSSTLTIHPEEHIRLSAFSPEELAERRDKSPGKIVTYHQDHVELPPAKVDFAEPKAPAGWMRCIHPEGAVYFHHISKGILTRCDLTADDNLRIIEDFADILHADLQQILPGMAGNATNLDLILDLVGAGTADAECQHYFVDHEKRIVFWLCPYNPSPIYFHVRGVQADDHIRLALETQYWVHCELFPHGTLDVKVCDTLRDILIHCMSEATLSDSALTPFTTPELQQMFDLNARIQSSGETTLRGHAVYVIARMMRVFTRMKFINFYGQIGARLNADQSIYAQGPKDDCSRTSAFAYLLDFILLGVPCNQFTRVRGLWVDNIISLPRWRNVMGTLIAEWSGITTYSTVMLAVNVSFLAVPGVMGTAMHQEVVVASIYLSTMFSVGSLISALFLTLKSRAQVTQSASEVASYMLKTAPSKSRLEILAITYSLPIAFITWGMLAFIVALGVTVFSSYGLTFDVVMALFCVLVVVMGLSPVLLRMRLGKRRLEKTGRGRGRGVGRWW